MAVGLHLPGKEFQHPDDRPLSLFSIFFHSLAAILEHGPIKSSK
jgi:hypothetical protein